MIEFAHLVYLAFLPSIGLGIALAIAWRFVGPGRLRTALQWVAALLFFMPQPFALFLANYSVGLRLYQQVLLALWGFGVSAMLVRRLLPTVAEGGPGRLQRAAEWHLTVEEARQTQTVIAAFRSGRIRRRGKFVIALAFAAMAGLGAYCTRNVVGDYLLDHDVVAGRVEGLRVIHNRRSPDIYQLVIDRRPYDITLDLAAQMHRGDYVEVDVGAASKTIVAIRRGLPATRE